MIRWSGAEGNDKERRVLESGVIREESRGE